MQSWNLNRKKSDIFQVLEEVLIITSCIFHPVFDCGVVTGICSEHTADGQSLQDHIYWRETSFEKFQQPAWGLQGGRVNLRSSEWLKGKIIKALVASDCAVYRLAIAKQMITDRTSVCLLVDTVLKTRHLKYD
ncbi:hypothetical protein HGM15179_001689, partial [Zosterops borbonicus]